MKNFNKDYFYDLDAINDFIFNDDTRGSDVEITVTQTTKPGGNLGTDSMVSREVKTTDNNKQMVRFEIIKYFMESLENLTLEDDVIPLSLGQNVVLNTMRGYGFLKNSK